MWAVLLFFSLCGLVQGVYRIDPLVSTRTGLIRGLSGDGYAKFLGVPYALVDANNPFGQSLPYPVFENIFEATESKICPQVRQGVPIGTLDCLTLDIYVPNTADSRNPLPVMVWIYGGAWVSGSNTAEASDPVTLLKHDVIVVAINYRVGVYGFLCLDTPEVPGNQGLKDQTLALRWIRDNIAAFGGNDQKITIFGESAGGMSVNLHLFSLNEKLFNQAIIQSGPALSYWMMVKSNDTIPSILAEELGYFTLDVDDALRYLSTVDPHLLVIRADGLKITSGSGTDQPLTKPCVEKVFEGVEHFITEHPMNVKASKARKTPIIIGHTRREFHFQYGYQDAAFFETYDLKTLFELGFYIGDEMETAINEVKQFYIGDEKISKNVSNELIDLGTDLIFGHSTKRMAEQLLESDAEKVYRYVYSYENASHGDELSYLFDANWWVDLTEEEQLAVNQSPMKAKLTLLWTNFAKYGNPTPAPSELIPFTWTPITKTTQPYLNMDSEFTLSSRPDHSRMAFWDLFYKLYGKHQKW
ncbi:hypothetical protein B5X24_HaOG200171 [Helicoverpa armigera]|uniref:Carboxylic ester hydrolase n=1 Tax=Helicoverpa armigera TaxID=29058 RepID=A0A2W1BXP7_HELAM|nr:hypothetical protein B5X24_HaOG200171 [Helicoverpa armigera]